jgi:hypothetical protein
MLGLLVLFVSLGAIGCGGGSSGGGGGGGGGNSGTTTGTYTITVTGSANGASDHADGLVSPYGCQNRMPAGV